MGEFMWRPQRIRERDEIDEEERLISDTLTAKWFPLKMNRFWAAQEEGVLRPEEQGEPSETDIAEAMRFFGQETQEMKARRRQEDIMGLTLLAAIPSGTAFRAALAPTVAKQGVKAGIAKVASAVAKPMEVVEQVPTQAMKWLTKRVGQMGEPITNKLAFQLEEIDKPLSPYQRTKLDKKVAVELADWLKKPGVEAEPVPKVLLKKTTLPEKISNSLSSITSRSWRMPRILMKADDFLERGKLQQIFIEPVENAADTAISGRYNKIGELRTLLNGNNIDLKKILTNKVEMEGFTFTPTERIGLYLLRRQPQALNHLVYGNKIPVEVVEKIADSITPQEKVLVGFIDDYIKQTEPVIGKIVKGQGKKWTPVENYFPIHIRWDLAQEMGFNKRVADERLLRYAQKWATAKVPKSFTKVRRARAFQPLEIDALKIFLSHMDGVEHYKAFMPVVSDLQKVIVNRHFTENFIGKMGRQNYQVLTQWLKDVASPDALALNRQSERLLRTMRVNATTAVLGLNITTALKQFPSFINGMAEIGEMAALKGFVTYIRHPSETINLLKQYAPQIYARGMSFEREIAEMQAAKGVLSKVTGKFSPRDIFMIMTTTLDRVAVNSLWRGAFDDAMKNGIPLKQAARFATQSIQRTQPFFGAKDVAEYWRSGEFMRAITMFTNQLNNNFNYYKFDIIGKRLAGRIGNKEVARRVIETLIIPGLMIGWFSRSRPAKNAGEFTKDVASQFLASVPLIGRFISSAIQGYTGSADLITTEVIGQIQNFAYNANKAAWDKVALSIPEITGYLTGFPVAQPRRTLQAIWDIADGKIDDWLQLIWGKYTREKAIKEERKTFKSKFKRRF